MKRLLITGVSGLLGANLAHLYRRDYEVFGTFNAHPVRIEGVDIASCDLCNYGETRTLVSRVRPDVVLHCASRTDVDAMEADREGGWQANVLTTRNLVDSIRDMNPGFIFVSTDSVYGGDRGRYDESGPLEPKNWYGATKLEAESVALAHPGALVLRTNLFGWNIREKYSLAEWFLAHLRAGQSCTGFTDARFSGMYTIYLGKIIEECFNVGLGGVFNCASRNSMTKFEFGREIAATGGFDVSLVQPGSIKDVRLPAWRGHDLSMDVSALEKALGETFPTVSESVAAFMKDGKSGFLNTLRRSMSGLQGFRAYPEAQSFLGYGRQSIDDKDIRAVVSVLKSPCLTQGGQVEAFEKELASCCTSKHAIAVNSGTAALHLACLACEVGPGDEVVTSPNTFLASSNCAIYCGATPVFCDIDPATYNMDPRALERSLTPKTKVVIPVHFAGQSCDMRAIGEVVQRAQERFDTRIFIIEDASHALGSFCDGEAVGACTHSDMAVFSFHPVKHITTGEGGAVLTSDTEFAQQVRTLRSHGISRDPGCMSINPGPWYYEQVALGYNYRITDMQCALGRSQLRKLPAFRTRRREIVDRYNAAFADVPHMTTPFESPSMESNFHLYVAALDFDAIGVDRKTVMQRLGEKGIGTQVHYIPVYKQPYYEKLLGGELLLPNTESYYASCLSLPLFPGMTNKDCDHVIASLIELMEGGADAKR